MLVGESDGRSKSYYHTLKSYRRQAGKRDIGEIHGRAR